MFHGFHANGFLTAGTQFSLGSAQSLVECGPPYAFTFSSVYFLFKDKQFPVIGHNYDSTALPVLSTFSVEDPACESIL